MDFLKGIRVVSFNHFLLGPVGMQILGDLGADIIAVEPVEGAFQRKWGGVSELAKKIGKSEEYVSHRIQLLKFLKK